MQRPDAIVDVSIDLWDRLAFKLISIIGEAGFQSLYERSVHLAGATFPWIEQKRPLQASDSRFAALKSNLEERDPADAGEASILLLITLIDILTLLIGELLTASILSSAWGDDVFDTAGKELL
jgi:hypothetical protein